MKKGTRTIMAFVLMVVAGTGGFVACGKTQDAKGYIEFLLNGTPIEEYTLVYDIDDTFARYCAENLSLLLEDTLGCKMAVASDKTEEQTHEILLGNTNRAASLVPRPLIYDENAYQFGVNQGKIVLHGDGYR